MEEKKLFGGYFKNSIPCGPSLILFRGLHGIDLKYYNKTKKPPLQIYLAKVKEVQEDEIKNESTENLENLLNKEENGKVVIVKAKPPWAIGKHIYLEVEKLYLITSGEISKEIKAGNYAVIVETPYEFLIIYKGNTYIGYQLGVLHKWGRLPVTGIIYPTETTKKVLKMIAKDMADDLFDRWG